MAVSQGRAADHAVLKAADFKYLGVIKLDSAEVGMHVNGLAYRGSTNAFFVVGNGGGKPYNLYESANVDPSPDVAKAKIAQVVHQWKESEALSPNDELPCGHQAPLDHAKHLTPYR